MVNKFTNHSGAGTWNYIRFKPDQEARDSQYQD
jgi:hypothetical protein